MDTVRILHIGDIHYPEHRNETAIHLKDAGFPRPVRNAITPHDLTTSVRGMTLLLQKRNIHGVLLSGDLTSWGDLTGYDACVRYMADALGVSEKDRWQPEQLHVVPGNHDVDGDYRGGGDLVAKFAPVRDAWTRRWADVLSAGAARPTAIVGDGGVRARLISINSCVGCREFRALPLPDALRDGIDSLVWHEVDSLQPNEAFKLYGERLDTPAFGEDDIGEVVSSLTELDEKTMPVILAHHNVLPQATLRIAIYTELMNGGRMRAGLTRCRRPVLYCHGHIHEARVEEVRVAGGGVLVCVAAPPLVEGFNVVEVEFGSKGYPLGCVVTHYRVRDGVVKPDNDTPVRIGFYRACDYVRVADDRVPTFLPPDKRILRLRQLRECIQQATGSAPQHQTIARVLEEAEWLGLVSIENKKHPHDDWQVERRIP